MIEQEIISASAFGSDFQFGVATAAYQIEGAYNIDGKGLSIWDKFSERKRKISKRGNSKTACDFYHLYEQDIKLMQSLGIKNFRFSISWPRIIPFGKGALNPLGIDFYNRVIDCCLKHNIQPWVTLYHWDLPYALQLEGGWTNRNIVDYFSDYTYQCAHAFGDRVNNWMVLNEPLAFTFLGHFLGWHAPGCRNMNKFVASIHHAALAQSEGGRVLKKFKSNFIIGTTYSCTAIFPASDSEKDLRAVVMGDALLNRMFIEPAIGLGYPIGDLPFLHRIEKYFKAGDENRLQFDFDFTGVQNYSREVIKHVSWIPYLHARNIPASKRNVPHTEMDWEVYPESIYLMIKKFAAYKSVKNIIVTENGAAFNDEVENGIVNDTKRIDFLNGYLKQVLRAKNEGINVNGYFIWSMLDNIEWAEGNTKRFGIVYTDFETQKRIVKNSGYWFKDFLKR